jgi:hypothetical protein
LIPFVVSLSNHERNQLVQSFLKDRNAPAGPPGPTLLPVAMTPALAAPAREATVSAPPGTITIEFGGTRVQVKGPVDAATLRTVLASLKGP